MVWHNQGVAKIPPGYRQLNVIIPEALDEGVSKGSHGAKQLNTVAALAIYLGLSPRVREELLSWISGRKALDRLDEVHPGGVWKEISRVVKDDAEARHFIDRILDPELSTPRPKGASPGKQSPPGGRTSKPRVAS
jgi:hypothetical protein